MQKSTSDMESRGQAIWLVRVHEKIALGIRRYGLPSRGEGELTVRVPTLLEQARAMRRLDTLPPGSNTPGGVIEFED